MCTQLTLLQNRDKVVQLRAFDAEEVVDDEGPALLVPSHVQVGSLGPWVQEVDDLRGQRKDERGGVGATVKKDRLFPRY